MPLGRISWHVGRLRALPTTGSLWDGMGCSWFIRYAVMHIILYVIIKYYYDTYYDSIMHLTLLAKRAYLQAFVDTSVE